MPSHVRCKLVGKVTDNGGGGGSEKKGAAGILCKAQREKTRTGSGARRSLND